MSILKLLKPVAAMVAFVRYRADRLRLARLVKRGMKVGRNVYIIEGVEFDYGYPHLIEIGDNCKILKGARILAHDATVFRDLGVTKIAPVRILEGSQVGERAFILPGVTIGPRAMVAACAVVTKDVGEDVLVAGNPARPVGKYSEIVAKYRRLALDGVVLDKRDLEAGKIGGQDFERIFSTAKMAFVRGVPQVDPFYVNADMDEIRRNAARAFTLLSSMDSESGARGEE